MNSFSAKRLCDIHFNILGMIYPSWLLTFDIACGTMHFRCKNLKKVFCHTKTFQAAAGRVVWSNTSFCNSSSDIYIYTYMAICTVRSYVIGSQQQFENSPSKAAALDAFSLVHLSNLSRLLYLALCNWILLSKLAFFSSFFKLLSRKPTLNWKFYTVLCITVYPFDIKFSFPSKAI